MMDKSSGSRFSSKHTLLFLLVCGIIFVTGYFISLDLLRSKIVDQANKSITSEIEAVSNYVDSKLQNVENILYAINWSEDKHSSLFLVQDFDYSEEQFFTFLENIILLHPDICGVAFGMDPEQTYYPSQGKYGYAPYVTDIDGEMKHFRLGADVDYSKQDWYRCAKERHDVYWNPFCVSSGGKIVSSFSLPLVDENGDVCGVFALDFYPEKLRQQCQEITSLKRDVVTILDKDFRFISHPDESKQLTNAADDGSELWNSMIEKSRSGTISGMVTGKKAGEDYVLYFINVKRTGWTVCVECPLEEAYSGVNELEFQTAVVSILSLLIVVLCFTFLYMKMRGALLSKVSIETDLKIAADLQRRMLPEKQPAFPERNDMDIYGLLQPARDVGGDMYDYILKEDKLIFCIGDVSGKGVPAAMYMSIVLTYFHNKGRKVAEASELVSSLNEILTSLRSENMFCTFFIGILNLRNGRLNYCNAGHDAPIIIRRSEERYIPEFLACSQNLVVGAIEDFAYKGDYTTLRPGDGLFLFTDGVTEAENRNLELFGLEATLGGIRKIFENDRAVSACDKVTLMMDELHRHIDGYHQSDDITMLMMEYKGTTIILENKIEQLSLLSQFVRDMCGKYSIPEDIVNDIDVSMDEIGSNIVMYAFPQDEVHSFYVSFHYEAGELVFTFEDDGVPFDPTQPTESHLDLPPEERPAGGLGIMMVKTLMDKVEYERTDDRNIVCIVKKCK